MKLWEGRFEKPTAKDADAFNECLSFDKKLYEADIVCSIAHATMLGECKIITKEESESIVKGLKSILSDIQEGKLAVEGYEDIHSFVENTLTQRIGEAGKKLHTARSRNDQVATDFRFYVRSSLEKMKSALSNLLSVLQKKSEEGLSLVMPGYTHLRKAQPINVGQYFNAYSEMFLRDGERLSDCYKRVNVMPLGSGALAGTSYPIDRNITKDLLGFDALSNNSLDAVSDRDFVAEYLFCLSLVMAHLSRLCEDTILYTSTEFGFWEMPDEYSTGSSIMPQKKNPDIPELVRGKTGRVYGHLMGILTVLKGLPLAYNKDLQEDKEALFDAEETVFRSLTIYAAMLEKISFNTERMQKAAEEDFTSATDVADYLAKKGVPFRDAHAITGKIVRDCLEQGKALSDLSLEEYQTYSKVFKADVLKVVRAFSSAEGRNSVGGSSSAQTKEALNRIRERKEKIFS